MDDRLFVDTPFTSIFFYSSFYRRKIEFTVFSRTSRSSDHVLNMQYVCNYIALL